MWVSPGLSDAGKYIKSCYKGVSGGGLCQSNFAPDGREGFLVTSDHYLYSTTYGTYISGNIAALYNDRTSIGFGSTTDKSKAAAIFYATPNGDGTSQVHLKDFSRNTEFYFCYYNQYVAPYSGDFNIGWSVVGYNPNNGGRGSWCIPTVLTLHD
jgi:hypothetical protein